MKSCYICAHHGTQTPATAICNERGKPVCEKHARGCVEDGHGTSVLIDPTGPHLDEGQSVADFCDAYQRANW